MTEDIHPLRAARLAKGLSLRKAASALGLGESGSWHIQRWEKGRHIPTLMYARQIVQVYGFVSVEEVQRLCREWQERQIVQE